MNEEKKLPTSETEVKDSTKNEEKVSVTNKDTPKKLSKGALIGIIVGGVVLVAAVVILVVLLSGGKCDSHIDANFDFVCDNCGQPLENKENGNAEGNPDGGNPDGGNPDGGNTGNGNTDGGNTGGDSENQGIEVTFKVLIDNTTTASGVKFTLKRGTNEYQLESGEDGTVKFTLGVGSYEVEFDYETLPEYCTFETEKIKVTADTVNIDINLVDNRPDGSQNKPFYTSEDPMEITLAPGQELFFNYRGSNETYIRVYHENAVICFNGEETAAVDGIAEYLLVPDSEDRITKFSVKNVSDSEITATVEVIAPEGTMDNPHEITGNIIEATIPAESEVYYRWTADKDGILVVFTSTLDSNVSVTKVLENLVPISSSTNGSNYTYISVKSGDSITICVSALAPTEEKANKNNGNEGSGDTKTVDITVDLVIVEGSEADPVPVLKDGIDLTFDGAESFVFRGEVGQTISISEETDIAIIYDGVTYTPDAETGIISITLTDSPVFTVSSSSDTLNGIRIEIN